MATEKVNPWANEEGTQGGKKDFENIRDMKFKDNHTHHIRILPNKETGKKPFFGYIQHWVPQVNSTKGKPITHAVDKKCVLCDFIAEHWTEVNRLKEEEEMTDKSPEIVKLYKKINDVRANKRYDMNILDRDDLFAKNDKSEEKEQIMSPKRMAANKTVWKAIFEYAKNPKWGNPSDAESGYDFEIVTEGEGERRSYDIIPDRDTSPLKEEEVKAMKRGFDLEKLRKYTTAQDMADVLKNAKPPYNDLLDKLASSDETPEETKAPEKDEDGDEAPAPTPKKEVKKEVKKEEKKEEKKVEKEEATEALEEKKEVEEKEETTEEDINQYECRGEYDKDDEACSDCPVKEKCLPFQPTYKKAKELKIDVTMKRSVEEIEKDVKAAEKPKAEEAAATGDKVVKRKKLPF